jgi:hypothetical protein
MSTLPQEAPTGAIAQPGRSARGAPTHQLIANCLDPSGAPRLRLVDLARQLPKRGIEFNRIWPHQGTTRRIKSDQFCDQTAAAIDQLPRNFDRAPLEAASALDAKQPAKTVSHAAFPLRQLADAIVHDDLAGMAKLAGDNETG